MKALGIFRKIAVIAAIAAGHPVWAATRGASDGGIGVWAIGLLAVAAAVILFQAMPAILMMGSMWRELFGRVPREARGSREVS